MALTCFNNKILTSGGRNIPPYIGKTIQIFDRHVCDFSVTEGCDKDTQAISSRFLFGHKPH